MRVTVCELTNNPAQLENDWRDLVEHTVSSNSELVLLPEMPFGPWLASIREPDPEKWRTAAELHENWLPRLSELGARTIILTRPVIDGGQRFNEGVVWNRDDGVLAPPHRKRYLPNETGFWEASWYSPGPRQFRPVDVEGVRIGFAICTEIWFFEHARDYSKQDVQILACPRATLGGTTDKWIAGARAAAVVSGAFCLSSNFKPDGADNGDWGGTGWIVEPEEGEVLGTTSRDAPFLTIDIDLVVADDAKDSYPRYVLD